MLTIGQLGKKASLSRSTLLYYDKLGLLKPSGRSNANYRLYTIKDLARLDKIMLYREAGISLSEILQLLQSDDHNLNPVLEKRLIKLNSEISLMRQQQQLIVKLLQDDSKLATTKTMNKQQWVAILKTSGLDEAAMRQWHIAFENSMPQAHSDFLESLGIDSEEIAIIKSQSNETASD